jgi:hypothetical protein
MDGYKAVERTMLPISKRAFTELGPCDDTDATTSCPPNHPLRAGRRGELDS